MKFAGEKINPRNPVYIPVVRGDKTHMFVAEAVLSYKKFDEIVPEPKPPEILKANGERFVDVTDNEYLAKMAEYQRLRFNYMFITSLAATPELEWEEVKLDDPRTWDRCQPELEASGLNNIEFNQLVQGVMRANSLDDTVIEKAKRDFLSKAAGL